MRHSTHLKSVVVELHDDGLWSAHPALHVHETGGRLIGRARPGGGRRRRRARLAVASFRQVLVHVLGEIAEEREPFREVAGQCRRAVAARLAGRVLEVQAAVSFAISLN